MKNNIPKFSLHNIHESIYKFTILYVLVALELARLWNGYSFFYVFFISFIFIFFIFFWCYESSQIYSFNNKNLYTYTQDILKSFVFGNGTTNVSLNNCMH